MGYSGAAIRKGMAAEYLAKAFFSKQGFKILLPDTHETSYDFIILTEEGEQARVQVKAAVFINDLVRLRNKHGANNVSYKVSDYDILCGVWVEKSRVYLFYSKDINENGFGEALTVDTLDGRSLSKHRRLEPYFKGNV